MYCHTVSSVLLATALYFTSRSGFALTSPLLPSSRYHATDISAHKRSHKIAENINFGLRLCAAAETNSVAKEDDHLIFSGVRFTDPLSSSLRRLKFYKPTPIQQAAIAPLTTGLSAILHAETGSGKTLAYLLPLLKRLQNSESSGAFSLEKIEPLQALIIVPSKELAVQIAADILTLTGHSKIETDSDSITDTEYNDTISSRSSLIHLCVKSSRTGLDGVTSPIIIGTPFKLLDAFRSSSESALKRVAIRYLVLDEVDRLLEVLGRYASTEDRRARMAANVENPVKILLEALVKMQPKEGMQVVAASATVGRPLRRELFRMLQLGMERDRTGAVSAAESDSTYGDMTVIRPSLPPLPSDSIPGSDLTVDDGRVNVAMGRKIGIPASITHVAILSEGDDQGEGDGDKDINRKLARAKDMWMKEHVDRFQRALLFVPRSEQVDKVVNILQFWGVKEARDLQSILGIASDRPVSLSDKKKKGGNLSKLPSRKPESSSEMLSRAVRNRIGSSDIDVDSDDIESLQDSIKNESGLPLNPRELLVVPSSGSRGLHVQGVDVVYVLKPPKTMDEYLHIAGRTGRAGRAGLVVTMVSLEELKRMQSWQTPLNIRYDVKYS